METRRGLALVSKRELNQKNGYLGEADLGRLISECIQKNWLLMQDVCLKTSSGEIQIDAIWVNNLGLTIFEIKNYTADYQYLAGR